MNANHKLKTWPEYYDAIRRGYKRFELRKNDRGFKVGDSLLLKEYDNESQKYTGNELYVMVQYILEGGKFGVNEGYVIMTITKPLFENGKPIPKEEWKHSRNTAQNKKTYGLT